MSNICIESKIQPSKVHHDEGKNKTHDVDLTETVQFKHFKPFLISMKIFGLIYTKAYCRSNTGENIHNPQLRKRIMLPE